MRLSVLSMMVLTLSESNSEELLSFEMRGAGIWRWFVGVSLSDSSNSILPRFDLF